MKKAILGIMLIAGSLSFANERENRDEKSFEKWRNVNFSKEDQFADEYINRGVQKNINEFLFKEVLFIRGERGSDRTR